MPQPFSFYQYVVIYREESCLFIVNGICVGICEFCVCVHICIIFTNIGSGHAKYILYIFT